jgi:hypothetical protein
MLGLFLEIIQFINGFGQTFVRRICDALEIVWCFGLIAFLLVKNTQQNQRHGDLLAKTLVIGEKDVYPEKLFEFENEQ